MKAYEQTLTYLTTLNLKGVANSLDEMIHDAEIRKTSYITFLNTLFTTEISYRVKRRVERNMVGAHFPVVKRIDDFNFGRVRGIGKSEADFGGQVLHYHFSINSLGSKLHYSFRRTSGVRSCIITFQ